MGVEVAVERICNVPCAFADSRHGQFALGEERFFAAGGAEEDRAVVGGAQQIDVHIHFGGVVQSARTQLHVLKRFAVGAQRAVVIHAAGHVGPMALQDFAVRGLLEIENVEGSGRDW